MLFQISYQTLAYTFIFPFWEHKQFGNKEKIFICIRIDKTEHSANKLIFMDASQSKCFIITHYCSNSSLRHIPSPSFVPRFF